MLIGGRRFVPVWEHPHEPPRLPPLLPCHFRRPRGHGEDRGAGRGSGVSGDPVPAAEGRTWASSPDAAGRSAGWPPRTPWPSWTPSSPTPRSSASRGSRASAAARSTPRSTPTTTSTTPGATWSSRRPRRSWSRRPTCRGSSLRRRSGPRQPSSSTARSTRPRASPARSTPTRPSPTCGAGSSGARSSPRNSGGRRTPGGDAVVIFEKANVVHMGDLVFNRIYPFVDRPGGASIRGWIKSLEDSASAYPADAIYVFGHGNPKFGVTGTRGGPPRHARLLHRRPGPRPEGDRGRPRQADRRRASRTCRVSRTSTRRSPTAWASSSARPSTN